MHACSQLTTYKSADSIPDGQPHAFPTEFLNSLRPAGIAPHELQLSVNTPIMLLTNICPAKGLTNGTRLICKQLLPTLIDAEVVTGSNKGDRIFIPRITRFSNQNDRTMPVRFARRQFPVRPCFAMTINKSQGQTFQSLGVYLPQPVFAHGQYYVALSRVGSFTQITIMVANGNQTGNVVYQEVIQASL